MIINKILVLSIAAWIPPFMNKELENLIVSLVSATLKVGIKVSPLAFINAVSEKVLLENSCGVYPMTQYSTIPNFAINRYKWAV